MQPVSPDARPSAAATSRVVSSAARSGSSAAATARPTTSQSAPRAIASPGVSTRAWSCASPPGSRMPGHHRAQVVCARASRDVGTAAHHSVEARVRGRLHARLERVDVRVTREHRDRERDRLRVSRVARALAQTVEPGAQHRLATGRVEVQELDTVPSDRARTALDGGGDVVQLEVGEHPETLVVQGIEGFRARPRRRARSRP